MTYLLRDLPLGELLLLSLRSYGELVRRGWWVWLLVLIVGLAWITIARRK